MIVGREFEMPACGRICLLCGKRLRYAAIQEMVFPMFETIFGP